MLSWYAVMTRPNRETLAFKMLELAKIEVLFPHYLEWRRIDPSTKRPSYWWKRPYFSRYIFVHCDRGLLGAVNDTPGVSTVVYAAGQEPFPIPDDFIGKLSKKLDTTGACIQAEPKARMGFRRGDKVSFKDSHPLWNFVGQVRRTMGDRVAVELERMLGASREVEAKMSDLELVQSGDSPAAA